MVATAAALGAIGANAGGVLGADERFGGANADAGGANADAGGALGAGMLNGGKWTGAGDAVWENCPGAASAGGVNGAPWLAGPGDASVDAIANSGAIMVAARASLCSGSGAETPCCFM